MICFLKDTTSVFICPVPIETRNQLGNYEHVGIVNSLEVKDATEVDLLECPFSLHDLEVLFSFEF